MDSCERWGVPCELPPSGSLDTALIEAQSLKRRRPAGLED